MFTYVPMVSDISFLSSFVSDGVVLTNTIHSLLSPAIYNTTPQLNLIYLFAHLLYLLWYIEVHLAMSKQSIIHFKLYGGTVLGGTEFHSWLWYLELLSRLWKIVQSPTALIHWSCSNTPFFINSVAIVELFQCWDGMFFCQAPRS
jgi:hypothetical protein